MDGGKSRNRQQIILQSHLDGWMRVHGLLDQSAEAASRSHRFMSLVASFSDKRRQMIERVVDRTLSAYTIHGEAIADSGWSESASIANLSKD